MKERPILFSSPMVRAILEGTKTQTRRVVKPQPVEGVYKGDGTTPTFTWKDRISTFHPIWPEVMAQFSPYGKPGDRLWVRETWMPRMDGNIELRHGEAIYKASLGDVEMFRPRRWRPSIFMPRWASRITLELTGVRVERLNSMSGYDALREGVTLPAMQNGPADPTVEFMDLWDSINARRGYSWVTNPWVWVLKFRRVQP